MQVVEDFLAEFGHQPPVVIADTAYGSLPGVTNGDQGACAVHRGGEHLLTGQIPNGVWAVMVLWHVYLDCGFTGVFLGMYADGLTD